MIEFKEHKNPLQIVLENRGVENISEFFNISWETVQSPHHLENISEAAGMLIKHMESAQTIAILNDPDLDGFSASALITNYLEEVRRTGLRVPEIVHLFHEGKTHGLSNRQIMRDLRDVVKPALLLVLDASGTDEEYQALNDIGIQVMVLDHHSVQNTGDNLNTIVVNTQQSPNYLNKNLAGAGVGWQFTRVLDEKLHLNFANNYLDLVAAACVADVMDLRSDETRFLIQEGLKLENIKSPFLRQCIKDLSYSLGGDLNPTNVAFYIAPLVNACIRIGTMEEKKLLFDAFLEHKAYELVESGKRGAKGEMVPLVIEAMRQITNAKARQKRRQDKLTEAIEAVIDSEGFGRDKVLIIEIDDFDDEQRSLSGLIANSLISVYRRPVILLFEEEGRYNGSLRAPSDIEAFADFRKQVEDSQLCFYAQGHPQAAGLSLAKENVQLLRQYFNEKYKNIDVSPTYFADFVIEANDPLLGSIIESLDEYKTMWGTGLVEPLIAVTNVYIGKESLSLLSADKNPTLKIHLPGDVVLMKFRSSKEEYDSLRLGLADEAQSHRATVVGKANVNIWGGKKTAQLIIENYYIHGIDYVFDN